MNIVSHIVSGLAISTLAIACSATETTTSMGCVIPGTYTFTATPQTQTAGCSALGDGTPTTGTVTINADGNGYKFEFGGTTGTCAATPLDTCKVQAKCDYKLADATDPKNSDVTLQFSWTFAASGFSGLNSGHVPPDPSLPQGCEFTSNVTGTKH